MTILQSMADPALTTLLEALQQAPEVSVVILSLKKNGFTFYIRGDYLFWRGSMKLYKLRESKTILAAMGRHQKNY